MRERLSEEGAYRIRRRCYYCCARQIPGRKFPKETLNFELWKRDYYISQPGLKWIAINILRNIPQGELHNYCYCSCKAKP